MFHHSPYAPLLAAVMMQDPLELRTSCCSSSVVILLIKNERLFLTLPRSDPIEFGIRMNPRSSSSSIQIQILFHSLKSIFLEHLFISPSFLAGKIICQFQWISSLPAFFPPSHPWKLSSPDPTVPRITIRTSSTQLEGISGPRITNFVWWKNQRCDKLIST